MSVVLFLSSATKMTIQAQYYFPLCFSVGKLGRLNGRLFSLVMSCLYLISSIVFGPTSFAQFELFASILPPHRLLRPALGRPGGGGYQTSMVLASLKQDYRAGVPHHATPFQSLSCWKDIDKL